jgi:hypothetical protein
MKSMAFSFVEILIAIICLAMVMIPLTTMFSISSSGTIQNRNDILARQHVANLIDYACCLPYNHSFLKPVNEKQVDSVSINSGTEQLALDMESIFTRSISIEEIKPAGWKYAYKVLKVKVKWIEARNKTKEIEMTGLITDESG